jgi:hypothetical protein
VAQRHLVEESLESGGWQPHLNGTRSSDRRLGSVKTKRTASVTTYTRRGWHDQSPLRHCRVDQILDASKNTAIGAR